MVIQCPNCSTKFKIDDSKIKDEGTKVRCTKCKQVFTATKGGGGAPAPAPEPVVKKEERPANFSFGPGDEEAEKEFAPPPKSIDLTAGVSQGFSFGTSEEEEPQADAAPAPVAAPQPQTEEAGFTAGEEGEQESVSFGFDEEDQGEAPPVPPAFQAPEPSAQDEFAASQEEAAPEETPAYDFNLPSGGGDEFHSAPHGGGDDFSVSAFETPPVEEKGPDADSGFGSGMSFGEVSLPQTEGEAPAPGFDFKEEKPFGEIDFTSAPVEAPSGPAFEMPSEPSFGSFSSQSFDDSATLMFNKNLAGKTPPAPAADVFSSQSFDDSATLMFNKTIAPKAVPAEPAKEAEAEISGISVPESVPSFKPEPFIPPAPAPSKRGFPVNLVALIALILAIVGGGLWYMKGGAEKETGQITLSDLNGNFAQNAEAGNIFVITGKAVNNTNKVRSFFQVKGIILNAKGEKVAQKIVYCGSLFTPKELSTMPKEKIEADMKSMAGPSSTNVNISPGQSVQFTIVFFETPQDMSEFSVEVIGSQVASE